MGTLSGKKLKKQVESNDPNSLFVTPILDPETQIGEVGIDLRLGNQFIVYKTENIDTFDARDFIDDQNRVYRIQRELVVPFGTAFILHPNTLVLGATLEYVNIPVALQCSLEGRSSWARIGLVIATATLIEPGFKGSITLELTNLAKMPLKLYPGTRVGQLICQTVTDRVEYPERKKKYICPIGPQLSKAHLDTDNRFFFESH